MVSVLLTVLKIIGMVLLIILGLILCILLLVLFVPVRYSGRGGYHDKLPAAEVRASWLLHMVSVRGDYQNGQALHIYMKILGITLYDNLRVNDKKGGHKKEKSTKNKTENAGEIQAASAGEDTSGDTVPGTETAAGRSAQAADVEPEVRDTGGLQEEPPADSARKLGLIQKIKNFFMKFVNIFKNIKFTFNRLYDTMVKIKDNINYYLKVLQLDSTKQALGTCRKQLGYVLGKMSPRKYRVSLHLGFDDPAVMGEVLAVWGMFYPLHQGNIDIQPEFEQTVMEGDFSFQGRVSVFVFVRVVCVLFFDKDVRRLIKHLKRGES